MREALEALTEELRRLKAAGVREVPVTDETLAALRRLVEAAPEVSAPTAAPERPVAPAAREPTVASAPAPQAARLGSAAATGAALPETAPVVELPDGDKATRWQALRARVLGDPVCRARAFAGKQVVFGVGALDAAIMFVGEAPGADEEDQGEPFVGRAGQLLNRMIKTMGLEREQVYIGNILNWRPEMPRNPDGSQTGNRPPTAAEMAYCLPFIRAQIAVVQPKVLVALGKTAVDGLLGADRFKSMGAARGAWYEYAGTPLRATYHPSYLLRQEGKATEAAKRIKRDAWEDLLAVMERAGVPISEKQRNYFR